mgnify:CR=1 FL=1
MNNVKEMINQVLVCIKETLSGYVCMQSMWGFSISTTLH